MNCVSCRQKILICIYAHFRDCQTDERAVLKPAPMSSEEITVPPLTLSLSAPMLGTINLWIHLHAPAQLQYMNEHKFKANPVNYDALNSCGEYFG